VEVTGEALVEVALERAGALAGRVVDAAGRPVAGATVEAVGTDRFGMPVSVFYRSAAVAEAHFDWALAAQSVFVPAGELGVLLGPVPAIPLGEVQPAAGGSLTTDEAGRFLIEDVPPGQIVVLARHPEHMDGKSAAVELPSGGRREVEIVLGTGEPLRGRVVDARGFPVPDARVRASARGYEKQVAVESDGTFALAAAPPLPRLSVSRAGNPLRTLFERELSAEERRAEVRLELPEPREPTAVRVLDASGDALGLAQVVLTSLARHEPLRATRFTDERGDATFEEVRGLDAELAVEAPGHVRAVVRQRLPAELVVRLVPALGVHGRVTGVRGRHVAARARVEVSVGDLRRGAVTDVDGEYTLTGLAAGRARVEASHTEYGRGSLEVLLARPTSGRAQELPDLDLAPPARVAGRVVDGSGSAVGGARLALERLSPYSSGSEGSVVLGMSSEDGSFEVDVPSGLGELYLYGAAPARSFGFSDRVVLGQRERVEGVEVLLDRDDPAPPDARGSVPCGLEEGREGLSVFAVAQGSLAQRAGLRAGDLLVAVDGYAVQEVEDARGLLSGVVGTEVALELERGAGRLVLRLTRESFLRR
jgi:hypothetical protein